MNYFDKKELNFIKDNESLIEKLYSKERDLVELRDLLVKNYLNPIKIISALLCINEDYSRFTALVYPNSDMDEIEITFSLNYADFIKVNIFGYRIFFNFSHSESYEDSDLVLKALKNKKNTTCFY